MIIKLVWDAIATFLGWLLSLFPTIAMPDWVGSVAGYANDGVAMLNGLYNWVPLDALRVGFAFVLTAGAVALAVRGVRIVISLLSGGGGSAG